MTEPALQPEIIAKIKELEKKFKNSGQDLGSYLDGLLYDKYLTYWDYIHLDTLLSLQNPRTQFPDEEIFIVYHQTTELYFKLVLHEIHQIVFSKEKQIDLNFFKEKLSRINRYFKVLIDSFDIMIKGMNKEQFLKYRMSLLPASGFQSVQFRMIELHSTPIQNLLNHQARSNYSVEQETDLEILYEQLYWKLGATDINTGEKTLTLKQFENKYTPRLLRAIKRVRYRTVYDKYLQLSEKNQKDPELKQLLCTFDNFVNINWLMKHLGAAYRYLNREQGAVPATGGTNWKRFLPPKFQKVTFFPKLWTEEELENWGKQWVDDNFGTP